MALKNGVVEQNLANVPAVSLFVYAPPKLRHLTTAFIATRRPTRREPFPA